jgi:hypothetical protein
LEAYIEKGKTWVNSLQNQAATQMVLINKLQTDTKQRVVLYDALTKSLKTAQQQDVAHRINEIGSQTDREAQTAMAANPVDRLAQLLDLFAAEQRTDLPVRPGDIDVGHASRSPVTRTDPTQIYTLSTELCRQGY